MTGNRIAADSVYSIALSLLPYGDNHKAVSTSKMYLKLYKEHNVTAAESILTSLRTIYPAPYALHTAETLYRLYNGGTKLLISTTPKEQPDKAVENIIPTAATLYQNYPNPFNPSTTITYYIEKPVFVSIEVYNIFGAKVASLVNTVKDRGMHAVEFQSGNLPTGVYIYSLNANGRLLRKTMNIVK